jgi:hypothetical protein
MNQNYADPSQAIDLSCFDEEYSRVGGGDEAPGAEIPDGEYSTIIEEVRLKESTHSSNPMLVWTLRIQGSNCNRQILHKNRVIMDRTLAWLKEDLQKCGISLTRLSSLPERLEEMRGLPIPVLKQTKDGRTNVYFRWKSGGPRKPAADDDLPF